MNHSSITKKLELLQVNPDEIPDKQIANTIRLLLQIIEELSEENEKLKAEVQKLRDEINQLKGEQGKPKTAGSKKRENRDISSEDERKLLCDNPLKEKKSKAKIPKIKIDNTEFCKVDPNILPEDAQFKGYKSVIVQEISIETKNTEYKKEVYYSPSQGKTYIAKLPLGVEGEFGPELKSLIYTLKHAANMSESKIHEFLESIGIYISPATISRILTKNIEQFHQEKADIFRAGLASTTYQQIDDTGAKVNGQNHYVQIICNLYYTAYFTISNKDRLSILDILQGGKPRQYYFNEEAFALLRNFNISNKMISQLRNEVWDERLNEEKMQQLMKKMFPDKGKILRTRIMEASAIAAYHEQTDFPVIPVLLSDDAPQFKQLTCEQGLCWVHDGRNYKKLNPVVPLHKKELDDFLCLYWDYYRQLLQFKEKPTPQESQELSAKFDQIFSIHTNYPSLNDRIEKTKAKKTELLMVLKYPQLPLHNNDAELGAREQVRKRDVSLHTMTDEGTKASDTFLTIVQTAKKWGVSFYDYIHDRVTKNFKMTSLAELIKKKKSSM